MLFGRDAERMRIEQLLADARGGESGALVIEAEPGAGKTSLLQAAVSAAGGMTVVRAVGVESEAEIEFSGLLTVLRPLLGGLDALPETQADALRGVLGLAPASARDRFAIGAATLSLLAHAAEDRPLLVVVDDAQWVDGASIDALCFAGRRLVADRVALLVAARTGEAPTLSAAGFEVLEVGELDLTAAMQLVESVGGRDVAPEVVARLRDLTGGNPLALLEIPGALSDAQLAGEEDLPDPLPAGPTVERMFARRLEALPVRTQEALVVLALAGDDDVESVTRALTAFGTSASDLEPAEDTRLVFVDETGIVFRHPLVRSVVAQSARPSLARSAHRALAEALALTGDTDRRAWHLAAAAVGPDAEAADALAAAAESATSRTGHATASRAFERAARLTPDAALRSKRLSEAAQAALGAGELRRADALAADALDSCDEDAVCAPMLHLRGRVELQTGSQPRAQELFLAAADLAERSEEELPIVGPLSLAVFSCHLEARILESIEIAERAWRVGPHDGSPRDEHASYALGRSLLLAGRVVEGRRLLDEQISRWLDCETQPRIELARTATSLSVIERLAEGADLAARVERMGRDEGPMALTYALTLSAELCVRAGRLQAARLAATEGLELARELDQPNIGAHLLLALARIAAIRGDEAACRAHAEEALGILEGGGLWLPAAQARCALGLLALGLEQPEAAASTLAAVVDRTSTWTLLDPDVAPVPDLVEALVRLGRTEEASRFLEAWLGSGLPAEARWAQARIARCHGLLADDEGFEDAFETSVSLHADGDPFALARTRLCYGERLRRVGRRVDAREQLRAAAEALEHLEATPWVTRVRRELRATGEKLGRRRADIGDELTPQELQIALQAAEGRMNKEIAAALFLSPKTVEFHLGRVYRKLDVSSRAELIRRFAGGASEGLAAAAAPAAG